MAAASQPYGALAPEGDNAFDDAEQVRWQTGRVPPILAGMDGTLRLEACSIDLATGRVDVQGEERQLTDRERVLLGALVVSNGAVLDRDALHAAAWGQERPGVSRAIDTSVRRLRAKIERDPARPRHVLTVHGDGYRFVPLREQTVEVSPIAPSVRIELPDRVVDLTRAQVRCADGTVHPLSARDVGVLQQLVDPPGHIVSREQILARVWGLRRASAARHVDWAVHRLRKKLEKDPADPRVLVAVAGQGYRLEPAGQAAGEPPTNVGDGPTRLFGREAELATLDSWWGRGARWVTVIGPGGVGKTSLARAHARASAGRFPGGCWSCDVSEARSALEVAARVAHAAGISLPEGSDQGLFAELARRLVTRGPALVILDDADAAVAQVAEVGAAWIRGVSGLSVLVTSRRRIGVTGEVLVDLRPLPADAGVQMLRELVGQEGAAWSWHGDAPRALVEALEGLPLAIELAARRATLLSPEAMLGALGQRFGVLKAERRGLPARQRSLWATLSWSWDLLDEPERRALARLSVFRAPFSFEHAERVLAPLPTDALDLVAALREASWIRADADPRGPRFALLDSQREFGARQLDATGERVDAELRHAEAMAEEAERLVAPTGKRDLPALWALRDDFMAAFEHVEARDPDLAARCLIGRIEVAIAREPSAVAIALVKRATDRLDQLGPGTRDRIALTAGRVHTEPTEAAGWLGRATLSDDPRIAGAAWLNLALAGVRRGDLVGAAEAIERAGPYVDGASGSRMALLYARGVVASHLGRFEEAARDLRECVAGADPEWSSIARFMLAMGEYGEGRVPEAIACMRAALQELEAYGNLRSSAYAMHQLAMFLREVGETDEAIAMGEAGVAASDRHGAPWHAGLPALVLTMSWLDRGDHARAEAASDMALARLAGVAPQYEAAALLYRARLELARGRWAEARACLDRGLARDIAAVPVPVRCGLLAWLAVVQLAEGDREAALANFSEARAIGGGERAARVHVRLVEAILLGQRAIDVDDPAVAIDAALAGARKDGASPAEVAAIRRG